jgi:thiol-disulfide isomerase/thioredoxin
VKNIILTILITLSSVLYAESQNTDNQSKPSFTLTTTDGKEIHVDDIKEGLLFKEHQNAVFLLMFGHNCPPCKEEIPNFIELTEKYKDKLTIVAVEVQGYSNEKLKEFKEDNSINYNLVSGKDNYDFVKHIVQRAGWQGAIPFLIAIDKHGVVQALQAGLIKKESLEELVGKLNK